MKLRKATIKDIDILFDWRNDALTRKQSHNKKKVTKEEHKKWLEKTLKDKDTTLYIVELVGRPVGTIRADKVTELSWTVAPRWRGRGYGEIMLKHATEKIKGKLVATILPDNIASLKMAKHAGFTHINDSDSIQKKEIKKAILKARQQGANEAIDYMIFRSNLDIRNKLVVNYSIVKLARNLV